MQKTIIALATVLALGSTAAMAQQQQAQDHGSATTNSGNI